MTATDVPASRIDIIGEPIRRTAEGFEIPVNLFWYRALPISCSYIEVSVDGETVSPERIVVHVNERDYPVKELGEHDDETWFVLDPARVRISGEVTEGEHDLEVALTHRIPYLFDEETGEHLKLQIVGVRRFEVPSEIRGLRRCAVSEKSSGQFGVILYSFTREYRARKYTFEEIIRKTGELGLGPGFEVVGFQAFRGFPNISDEVALRFRRLLDEAGLEPSILSGNVDVGRRPDRHLSDDEVVDLLTAQLNATVKLGYPALKIQFAANANVIRRLVPICEKAGVKVGPEQHAPHAIDHPTVVEWLELFDELDTPYVGIVPDFGVAARKLHPKMIESQRALGLNPEAVDLVVDTWNRVHAGSGDPLKPFKARRELLKQVAAIDEKAVGLAWRSMTLFGHQTRRSGLR